MREQTRENYDRRHGARPMEPLGPGQDVWITDCNEEAQVVQEAGTRSHEVQTTDGSVYRCNRCALVELPNFVSINTNEMTESSSNANKSNPNTTNSTDPTTSGAPRRSTHPSHVPDCYDPS